MTEITKIALTGRIRSGKDVISDLLYYEHGFEFPMSFGAALKRNAHEIFPDVPKDPKPRALYQFMNVMRDFDSNVWITHVERFVKHYENQRSTTGLVISDVRQTNEYDWCVANGFTIIRVVASEDVRRERAEAAGDAFEDADLLHSTESYSDGFNVDYQISNDGTLAELKEQVDAVIAKLRPQA